MASARFLLGVVVENCQKQRDNKVEERLTATKKSRIQCQVFKGDGRGECLVAGMGRKSLKMAGRIVRQGQ